jgi:hypothetical protein
MTTWAALLSAIAALLWPVFAFTLLLIFRNEVKRLISRLKKGKILGQEIELEESLDKLQELTSVATNEVAALPPSTLQLSALPAPAESMMGVPETRILERAARSPKAALLLLSAEIEREMRRVVASLGLSQGRQTVSLVQGLALLSEREALPKHVASSVELFLKLRNELVHGREAGDDDILRAIDIGTTILKAIRAIPREVNVVHHSGIELYSDQHLTRKVAGAHGVLLRTESPGGAVTTFRIFPSTRTHFQKGMRVSWEWSPEHIFDECWYRDAETGSPKLAWSSSMEFVGRDLDSV